MSFNIYNIIKIDLFSYEIPYNKELFMMGHKLLNRKGLFLKIHYINNQIYWGEISPLPGLHKENIKDIINYINADNLLSDFNLLNLNIFCKAPPSLLIAYEQILFNHSFNSKLISDIDIYISPLLSGNSNDIIKQCHHIKKLNINSIKLKLGRNKLSEDIQLFNNIGSILNDKIKIRVDVNRAWTYEDASQFAKNVNISKIDYIEEPLININNLNKYYDEHGINLALDETIYQTQYFSNLLKYKGCSAFIIKPSLIGGTRNMIKLKAIADNNNIDLIFSSAFETGYSIAYYIYLSSIYSNNNIAQGFDTYKYLSYDILNTKLGYNNNTISLKNAVKSMNTISQENMTFVKNIL